MDKYEVFASITRSTRAKLVVEARSEGEASDKLLDAIDKQAPEVEYSPPNLSILRLGGHRAAEARDAQ